MNIRPGSLVGLILPLGIALVLALAGPLRRWDHAFYDRALALLERSPDASIALVAIDERSLERLGRWPWSRLVHARFLDRLTDAGVRAVGLDVLFAEPDASDPEVARLAIDAERLAYEPGDALGLRIEPNLLALDSGCLWGRHLTAVRLPGRDEEVVRVRVAVAQPAQQLPSAIADLRRRGFEPYLVSR